MIDTNAYIPTRAEHRGEVLPSQRVFAGILMQAVNDIRRTAPKNLKLQRSFVEAWLWIASDREDYSTSYQKVCYNLRMDPDKIRKELNISTGDSFFGWKRLAPRKERKSRVGRPRLDSPIELE